VTPLEAFGSGVFVGAASVATIWRVAAWLTPERRKRIAHFADEIGAIITFPFIAVTFCLALIGFPFILAWEAYRNRDYRELAFYLIPCAGLTGTAAMMILALVKSH
jgi:hypothetical protein